MQRLSVPFRRLIWPHLVHQAQTYHRRNPSEARRREEVRRASSGQRLDDCFFDSACAPAVLLTYPQALTSALEALELLPLTAAAGDNHKA